MDAADLILALRRQGLTDTAIARAVQCERHTIGLIARRQGNYTGKILLPRLRRLASAAYPDDAVPAVRLPRPRLPRPHQTPRIPPRPPVAPPIPPRPQTAPQTPQRPPVTPRPPAAPQTPQSAPRPQTAPQTAYAVFPLLPDMPPFPMPPLPPAAPQTPAATMPALPDYHTLWIGDQFHYNRGKFCLGCRASGTTRLYTAQGQPVRLCPSCAAQRAPGQTGR